MPQRLPLLPPFVDRLTMLLIIVVRVEPSEAVGPSNPLQSCASKGFAFFADPDGLPWSFMNCNR